MSSMMITINKAVSTLTPAAKKAIARHGLRASGMPIVHQVAHYYGKERIGKREVVGYGWDGSYNYFDRPDYPCPSIRFQEETPEIKKIREKEKGDWRKLTLEEKKKLYRFSFMRTFAEVQAPTGEWKQITAMVLTGVTVSLLAFLASKQFLLPPLPYSCSPEEKERQLGLMLAYRVNPISGVSSKWDYENNRWKE